MGVPERDELPTAAADHAAKPSRWTSNGDPSAAAHSSSSASSSKSTPRSAAGTISASLASLSSKRWRPVGQTHPVKFPARGNLSASCGPPPISRATGRPSLAGRGPDGRETRLLQHPGARRRRILRERLETGSARSRPAHLQNCFNVAQEFSPPAREGGAWNRVRGVVEGADWHSPGWSAPKSQDFGG